MRSLEAFIEENGQWERAADGSTATATRCATGSAVEELTGRDLATRATGSNSGSRYAGRELVP